jgi:hypothetical protein
MFPAAVHSPAASSAADAMPPAATGASSTVFVVAISAVPSAASVWIAYWAARSLTIASNIDGTEKSMFCRDTFT